MQGGEGREQMEVCRGAEDDGRGRGRGLGRGHFELNVELGW